MVSLLYLQCINSETGALKVFLWFSFNGAGWSVASLRLISSPDHIFAVEIRPRRGVYALISAHLRLLLFCYLAYQSTDVGTVIRSGWSSSVMIGEEKERVVRPKNCATASHWETMERLRSISGMKFIKIRKLKQLLLLIVVISTHQPFRQPLAKQGT